MPAHNLCRATPVISLSDPSLPIKVGDDQDLGKDLAKLSPLRFKLTQIHNVISADGTVVHNNIYRKD